MKVKAELKHQELVKFLSEKGLLKLYNAQLKLLIDQYPHPSSQNLPMGVVNSDTAIVEKYFNDYPPKNWMDIIDQDTTRGYKSSWIIRLNTLNSFPKEYKYIFSCSESELNSRIDYILSLYTPYDISLQYTKEFDSYLNQNLVNTKLEIYLVPDDLVKYRYELIVTLLKVK